MRQVAEIEAKKAVDYLRKEKAEQAEKKALLDQLSKPSGLSEDAKKKRAAAGTTFHFVTNGIARTRTGRGCGQGRVDRRRGRDGATILRAGHIRRIAPCHSSGRARPRRSAYSKASISA
jgi:hypothetical protein